MEKRHVILTGPRGSGKSSMISAVVRELCLPVYGFVSDFLPADRNGYHPIYIHPADEKERFYREENCLGTCDTRIHNIRPEVFDSIGADFIRSAHLDGILVMDELGFMEERSPSFMQAVEDALDGKIPVLAACKDRTDIAFLNRIRSHPAAAVFMLDAGKWESTCQEVIEMMRRSAGKEPEDHPVQIIKKETEK